MSSELFLFGSGGAFVSWELQFSGCRICRLHGYSEGRELRKYMYNPLSAT